jgi:hypothetical protein
VGSGKRTAPHSNKSEGIRHSAFWNKTSSNGHGLERRFTAVMKQVSSPKSHLSCLQLCRFSIELLLKLESTDRQCPPRLSPASNSCSMEYQAVAKALIVLPWLAVQVRRRVTRVSGENAGLCSPGLNLALLPARSIPAAHLIPNT